MKFGPVSEFIHLTHIFCGSESIGENRICEENYNDEIYYELVEVMPAAWLHTVAISGVLICAECLQSDRPGVRPCGRSYAYRLPIGQSLGNRIFSRQSDLGRIVGAVI